MKTSNDTIGNRTRDLPACSAVPRPTAPSRAPYNTSAHLKLVFTEKKSGPDAVLSGTDVYESFEGICCFHIQDMRTNAVGYF
jgi:hypothetical protein